MARILLADDQPHITHVLSLFLTRKGHDVTRATDGRSALELIREQHFDLLITDVDMPHMDGLSLTSQPDVTSRLRAIIILTGRNDFASIKKLKDRENIRVAPKPFSPSQISHTVDELLALQPQST